MKNFSFEKLKKGEIAVHTKTRAAYDSFMRACSNNSIKWTSGEKATEFDAFEDAKENTFITCVSLEPFFKSRLGYSSTASTYENEGIQIVEWTEEYVDVQSVETKEDHTADKFMSSLGALAFTLLIHKFEKEIGEIADSLELPKEVMIHLAIKNLLESV